MTTMPIDNHPFTQRRPQFIGISVRKLTLKSINIIQLSNNYNIVSSFICWNQNIDFRCAQPLIMCLIIITRFKMDVILCLFSQSVRILKKQESVSNILHKNPIVWKKMKPFKIVALFSLQYI